MKEDIARIWIKALRSGKYRQGRRRLRKGDRFCCLGVLCDLHSKQCKCKWCRDTYCNHDGTVPWPTQKWAGLRSGSPAADGVGLTELNDTGKRFTTIAKVIEKHWRDL